MKKKICVVTATRAEYGLLRNVIRKIQNDKDMELQLVVTGMHLSPEFGLTYREIEEDNIKIDEKIEILMSSDTAIGVSKSIGLAIISFSEYLNRKSPDMVVLLGDRSEMMAFSIAANIAGIPISHIHGGESTEGAYDEAFRHSISKMSYLHFTSTAEYRNRVIQLGEHPDRVFNVGALGVENIKSRKLLNKEELQESIKFNLDGDYALVTFHPVTYEKKSAVNQFKELLNALDKFPYLKVIFTKSNSDNEGRAINKLIDEYVKENSNRAVAFVSLGQHRYLSALKYCKLVIGNSSSGIIEAPSFKNVTINIGDRQKGRIQGKNTINVLPSESMIIQAIKDGLRRDYNDLIIENPYYREGTSDEIIRVIKDTINRGIEIKKSFYDLNVSEGEDIR